MRYKPDEPREDDPVSVAKHKGLYCGGKALVILGGYSAANWLSLYSQLRPDVIIGANGVNGMVDDLDYWVLSENMKRSAGLAKQGDVKSMRLMEMFYRDSGAKCKMVSHWSWVLLKDTRNCISIRRQGRETKEMDDFTLRDYGMGFLAGWLQKNKDAGAAVHVGTVGAQCLHMAGILGCAEVHTIGYDLMFRNHERHHAYDYPVYEIDKFRTPAAFKSYKGAATLQTWIESAQWLKEIEYVFKRDGLKWIDHSDGLLKIEGLRCAA